MAVVNSDKPCTICEAREPVMHSHHTVPQSRGGTNSLQIILCASCHNSLHAAALYICSQIRQNTKRKPKRFWRTEEDSIRAQPYLEILVKAILSPIPEGCSREHLLSTPVSTQVFESFKLLQSDLGLSSQEQTLLHCVKYTLANKGIQQHEKNTTGASSLWFLHVPPAG